MLIGLSIFVGIAILYYFKTKPRISKNQNRKGLSIEESKRPILPENPTRTEYLKNKFFEKSNSELINISNSSKRIPEALRAAKEILEERKNVT